MTLIAAAHLNFIDKQGTCDMLVYAAPASYDSSEAYTCMSCVSGSTADTRPGNK